MPRRAPTRTRPSTVRARVVAMAVTIAGLAAVTATAAQADTSRSPELVPFIGTGKITATWEPGGYHPEDRKAIDIAMAEGTPVHAAGAGTVKATSNDPRNCDPDSYDGGVDGCIAAGYHGISVTLSHSDGSTSKYAHLSQIDASISVGVTVTAGQRLGLSGNSGTSTGPHLHYQEDNASGTPVDPGTWYGCDAQGERTVYTNLQAREGQEITNTGYGCVGVTGPTGGSTGGRSSTVVTDTKGQVWMFATKRNGDLYYRRTGSGGWESFKKVGKGSWATCAPAVTVDTKGQVWMFATKANGDLYYRRTGSGGWEPFHEVGNGGWA